MRNFTNLGSLVVSARRQRKITDLQDTRSRNSNSEISSDDDITDSESLFGYNPFVSALYVSPTQSDTDDTTSTGSAAEQNFEIQNVHRVYTPGHLAKENEAKEAPLSKHKNLQPEAPPRAPSLLPTI